ncbi:MAG: O-antigen ligase family protein [bacterium]
MQTNNGLINKRVGAIFLVVATVIFALIIPFLSWFDPFKIILSIILVYVFIIALINNLFGLFLLLLIRPILDVYTNQPIASFGYLSINLASLLAILTLIFAGLVVLKHKERIKSLPIFKPILLFLFITLISIFFSLKSMMGLIEWVRLLSIFALYGLGYFLITDKKDLFNLIKVISLSILLPVILAFYQFFTKTGISIPADDIYNRIYGTFAHPNLLAFYLLIPLFLGIWLAFKNKLKLPNPFWLFLAVLYAVVLTLTYTRGAWLAFLITLVIIGLAQYRKLLIITLGIIFIAYLAIQPLQIRINDIISPSSYGSVQWRYDLWQDSLDYAKNKPLMGYGTGTSTEIIIEERGPELGSPHAHNDYLKILLENGVIGLAAYLSLIILIFYNLFKKYRTTNGSQRDLVLVVSAISLGLFIMSFGDNVIRNTALQWTYWAMLGGVLATSRK